MRRGKIMAIPKTLDPETYMVLDLGNSGLKDMVLGHPLGKEDLIAHAVQQPNAASYGALIQKAKYQSVVYRGSAIFEMDDQAYIVGDAATHSGKVNRITGDGKYKAGYWDALTVAKFLRRFPEGHNNLFIAIAHPANATPYIDQMMDLIGGKHVAKTIDGRMVKWVVRGVIPWTESDGGTTRWMNLPAQIGSKGTKVGTNNSKSVKVGDRILVIDIGGKISSMTPVIVADGERFETIYDPTDQPFDLGIQDILDTLAAELKSLHPSEFKGLKTIPLNMLEEALRTDHVTISGRPVYVGQAVKNSIYPLIDQLDQRYQNKHGGGKNFRHIVNTGGGSGLLYKHLVDEDEGILNHPNVYLADTEDAIQFANLRGGAIAFGAWLAEEMAKAKR
jgi:hypothetical protein